MIDVEMAALNFADLLMMRGLYQYRVEPPFAPGMECVGMISEIGEGVEGFAIGQRVAGMSFSGALAERCSAPLAASGALPSISGSPWVRP